MNSPHLQNSVLAELLWRMWSIQRVQLQMHVEYANVESSTIQYNTIRYNQYLHDLVVQIGISIELIWNTK